MQSAAPSDSPLRGLRGNRAETESYRDEGNGGGGRRKSKGAGEAIKQHNWRKRERAP